MAVRDTAVFGIYSDRLTTEIAIDTLKAEGFRNTDISALFPGEIGTEDFAKAKQVKVPKVAAFALAGAMVSELVSWLATAGTTSIPGPGTLASATLQITTLAGLVAGGALGYLIVALAGTKTHDSEERYTGRVRRGDILVSVHCEDSRRSATAKEILQRTGGADVSSMTKVMPDSVKLNLRFKRPAVEKIMTPSLRVVSGGRSDREAARSESHGESSVA